eukprot:9688855-Lingulodinium_polyedra.AAC.1
MSWTGLVSHVRGPIGRAASGCANASASAPSRRRSSPSSGSTSGGAPWPIAQSGPPRWCADS